MTTLQEEAMSLVALLPNPQRYSEKLNQLLAAKAEAETAIANLKLQQIATAEAMTTKLQIQENLLGMLQGQTDEIENARAAAAAKLTAAETDLSHRTSELESAKVAHADEVKRAMAIFEKREADLAKQANAHSERLDKRAADMQREHDRLSVHHRDLRSIIASARQGLAAV